MEAAKQSIKNVTASLITSESRLSEAVDDTSAVKVNLEKQNQTLTELKERFQQFRSNPRDVTVVSIFVLTNGFIHFFSSVIVVNLVS